ncbi:MAG: hypothetical protein WDN72_03030 [Alphaproteobacteria bacterium]
MSNDSHKDKHGNGVKPTLVLIDRPARVEMLKQLLKGEGYKVLAVALNAGAIDEGLIELQEKKRAAYKKALEEKGEDAVNGMDRGIHYKFRIESEHDLPEFWAKLQKETKDLPKGGEICAVLVGSKAMDYASLLALTRPKQAFIRDVPLVLDDGGGKSGISELDIEAGPKHLRKITLLPRDLLIEGKDSDSLDPKALSALERAVGNGKGHSAA